MWLAIAALITGAFGLTGIGWQNRRSALEQRDDHARVHQALIEVRDEQREQRQDLRGISADVRVIRADLRDHDRRLTDIEEEPR